jgi:hypothetical protein
MTGQSQNTDPTASPPAPSNPPPAADPNAPPPSNASGAEPPKKPEGTTLGTGGEGTEPKPGTWTENWRQLLATGEDGKVNDKELERLNRMTDPKQVWKSYRELEAKMATGKAPAPSSSGPPENATPEQLTAWRKEQGLATIPEEVDLPLPTWLSKEDELDDGEKLFRQSFRKWAVDHNVPKALVKELGGWVLEQELANREAAVKIDGEAKRICEDELRKDWGVEYRGNLKETAAFMDKEFGTRRDDLLDAVLPNGVKLGDDPYFVRYFAQKAKDFSGGLPMVDGSGAPMAGSPEARIAEIDKIRETNYPEYQRLGLGDEKISLMDRIASRSQGRR